MGCPSIELHTLSIGWNEFQRHATIPDSTTALWRLSVTKLPAMLLAILVALWGVVLLAVSRVDDPYSAAKVHSEHRQMLVAGDLAQRDAEMTGLSAVFGGLIISFYLTCLLLGAGRNGTGAVFRTVVILAGTLLGSCFLVMTFSVDAFLSAPTPRLVGDFPLPTAWMVYGVWICPVIFLAIYVFGFRSCVMTDDDKKRLEAIVAEKAGSSPEGQGA